MAAIRIRVGASADASMAGVFLPLSKGATVARQNILEEMRVAAEGTKKIWGNLPGFPGHGGGGGGGGSGSPAKRAARDMGDAMREMAKAPEGASKALHTLLRDLKEIGPSAAAVSKVAQSELAKVERAMAKTALGLGGGGGAQQPGRWSQVRQGLPQLASAGVTALGMGGRLIADVARGAGLNIDPTANIQKAMELQSNAIALSNSGYMAGDKGANGKRQDPNALMADVRNVGDQNAMGYGDVMSGLRSYVGLTGDLKTGRDTMAELAKLSKATGASFDDIASAAGNAANSIADGPDKAAQVLGVMRTVAGQGKLGAVEIKDMASQMAKLAATAGMFAGDRAQNMGLMGALAQEARQKGGAPSAAAAATAVGSFANIFSKAARLKQFNFAGVDVFERNEQGEKTGRIKAADSIIIDALRHSTKGNTAADPEALSKMISDANAKKVVRGFETKYRDTFLSTSGTHDEKVEAATAAVKAEFEHLKNSSMGLGEVQDSFAAAMGSDESKVQSAQNEMEKAAGDFVVAVRPAATALIQFTTDVAKAGIGFVKDVSSWIQGKDISNAITDDSKGNDAITKRVTARNEHRRKNKGEDSTATHVEMANDLTAAYVEQMRGKNDVQQLLANGDTGSMQLKSALDRATNAGKLIETIKAEMNAQQAPERAAAAITAAQGAKNMPGWMGVAGGLLSPGELPGGPGGPGLGGGVPLHAPGAAPGQKGVVIENHDALANAIATALNPALVGLALALGSSGQVSGVGGRVSTIE